MSRKVKRSLENLRSADELVRKLLVLSATEKICLLDSCGVSHLGSHLLIGGIRPLETYEISGADSEKTLAFIDRKFAADDRFAIFSISYDFGLKLNNIRSRKKEISHRTEPDVFLSLFDCLIVHDFNLRETFLCGLENRFDEFENLLNSIDPADFIVSDEASKSVLNANFTKSEYLEKIRIIKEYIRRGDTYQTNLTQQFTAALPIELTPQKIYYSLRNNHPAPFAAFIQRKETSVISASPERFFLIKSDNRNPDSRIITTSPIKGTRPRGKNPAEDESLRVELNNSAKDRAENVMIVDLLRNDLGKICEFGTVSVEKLCDLEEHPTFFHLVSTVNGNLRQNTAFSDVIRAVFPCGSITGAPKLRTMQIIDEIETANRGLSMGAIGFFGGNEKTESEVSTLSFANLHLSVAIRTMVIRNRTAVFNVGGGIVIDSEPENEYEESLTKAKALISALNC